MNYNLLFSELKKLSDSWQEYQRLKDEAISYLLGHKTFYDCDLKVQVALEVADKALDKA